MQEPQFINDTPPENKALNFNFLYSEGVKIVQELTGAFWTDYNPHDPGVTILEQLCYALTEVAYRTNLPIQDLLHQGDNQARIFYQPAEILNNKPLTINDFRKVIIDEIPEVQNLWLFPVGGQEFSLRGLYKIYVDLYDYTEDAEVQASIIQKVRLIFGRYRNLCEDIHEITIVKPILLSIYADIEVESSAEVEDVLASIYFQLNQSLNPEIHFYSLREMFQKGKTVQEMFTGPLLKHGFIEDHSLTDKIDKILVSELIKIIMQVPGVTSIKNLSLFAEGKSEGNQLKIGDNQGVRLIFGSDKESNNYTINFYKGNLPYTGIERNKVDRKYHELNTNNKRVYRLSNPKIDTPTGTKLNIAEYYSVQNHFPITYGIGEDGIAGKPDEARKAQAKQLKAFLLFFEQILANYLAQLANVKNLFSPQNNQRRTYFYQNLHTVPRVNELLADTPQNTINDILFGKNDSIPQSYEEGLPHLLALQDDFLQRRNRFLDFFLAVNGISYYEYEVSQKQFYKDPLTFAEYLIASKTYFLEKFPELSQNRAQAFDYTQEVLNQTNLAGLEYTLMILLGMGGRDLATDEAAFRRVPIFYHQAVAEKLFIIDNEQDSKLTEKWFKIVGLPDYLNAAMIDNEFDFIDDADLKALANEEDKPEMLNLTRFYPQKLLSIHFLREATDLRNYKLGQAHAGDNYHLVFREDNQWIYLAELKYYEDAFWLLKSLLQFLKKQNAYQEQLYLLEHILLRPQNTDQKFGFYILNEKGDPVLKSSIRYNFAERQALVAKIEPFLYDSQNYSVERRNDGNFEIQFQMPNDSLQLVSLKNYISVQEIHQVMESLYEFIANKRLIVPYEEKISFFIQISEEDEAIPEDFFNHHISLLLPAWTARFTNSEYRKIAESIIRENTPAHIAFQIAWLATPDMGKFEELYYEWLQIKRESSSPNPQLENLENQLIRFLTKQ
ncbi:MAG: hypothetical protein MUE85_19515 [Microscillaceae bacterium]|jgi:hypothetical protein|nr:hypothetical protein [Microscillaceae bacterium]